MKKLFPIIIALVLFLLPVSIVLAVDTSQATYTATIRITNNSTATTNVAVPFTADTDVYIDGGYMNSSANNTAVLSSSGADVRYMPAISGNTTWSVFVPSIGANTIKNDTLYMGGTTDMGGLIRYFPGAGGMTTVDSATLKLGENFTESILGWFDATVTGNITDKPDAYRLDGDGSGNITARLFGLSDNFSQDNYTDVGGKVAVSTGDSRLNYEAERSATSNYAYDGITTVSDISWTLGFTLHMTSVAGAGYFTYGLWDAPGVAQGFAGDSIAFTINGLAADLRAITGGALTHSSDITVTANTTYYVSLVRNSTALATLHLYSDEARTTEVDGSPVALAITVAVGGLDTLQGSNFPDSGGAEIETIGWIDSLYFQAAAVSALGVASGEYDIEVIKSADSELWGTGSVLQNTAAVGGVANFGDIYPLTDKFVMSLWFKFDSTYSSDATVFAHIYGKRESSTDFSTLRFRSDTGKLEFVNRTGSVDKYNLLSTQTSWTGGQWYHVVISTNQSVGGGAASNGARMRVEGGAALTDADLQTLPASGAFVLGHNTSAGSADGFPGQIMNVVVIIDDDVTAAEELGLYNKVIPSGAADIWYLDEGIGTRINSFGTSSNNGTAGAATSWATSTHTGVDNTGRLNNFILSIDDVGTGINTHIPVSVIDNSSNWTSWMTYIEYQEITIGGVQRQYIEWENAAIFTDASGNGNDATPTFRTISSDADVSAVLVDFAPVSEARAPAYAIDIPTTGWITENITTTGNYTSNVTASTYPGSAVITDIATAGETPVSVLTLILGCGVILAFSLFISWIMKANQERSLMIKLITVAAGVGIMIAVAAFDQWLLYMFLMIGIAIVMASSSRTFSGTGNTGNNMLGFLSMSFVGMTMINRILEGRLLQTTDIAIVREVVAFQPFNVFGLFTIPVPNVSFLTNGIPALMRWDYSFFGGNSQIIQYLLYSVTAVVSFMLFVLVFGAIYQMFSRGR